MFWEDGSKRFAAKPMVKFLGERGRIEGNPGMAGFPYQKISELFWCHLKLCSFVGLF